MTLNHLHLVSDSTGGTAHSVALACMSQFEAVNVEYHNWTLIKTKSQLESVLDVVRELPGPVFYTLINEDLTTFPNFKSNKGTCNEGLMLLKKHITFC